MTGKLTIDLSVFGTMPEIPADALRPTVRASAATPLPFTRIDEELLAIDAELRARAEAVFKVPQNPDGETDA